MVQELMSWPGGRDPRFRAFCYFRSAALSWVISGRRTVVMGADAVVRFLGVLWIGWKWGTWSEAGRVTPQAVIDITVEYSTVYWG